MKTAQESKKVGRGENTQWLFKSGCCSLTCTPAVMKYMKLILENLNAAVDSLPNVRHSVSMRCCLPTNAHILFSFTHTPQTNTQPNRKKVALSSKHTAINQST
jgi:hypothetical protein